MIYFTYGYGNISKEEIKMKKVLTVLAILVLVAGFAFADEVHTIKLKTKVNEVLPAFQLVFNSNATNSEKNAVNTTNGSYVIGDPDRIDVGFDLGVNGEHATTFYAKVVKGTTAFAKTTHGYTLTFGGGTFKVRTAASPNTDVEKAPTITVTKNSNSITGITSISEPSGPAVEVQFSGATMTDETVEIAHAEYKWAGDSTILPSTAGYNADVTLTIAAK